jgi:hypothetical protein
MVEKETDNIKLYGVKHKSLQSGMCLWMNIKDAIEEIKSHLEEGIPGDTVEVIITEMSKSDYDSLPEFEGY